MDTPAENANEGVSRTLSVATRECFVLAAGCLFSWGMSYLLSNGRPAAGPPNAMVGILLPIGFCLFRAALIGYPDEDTPAGRRIVHQVIVALALLLLLIFEIGVGVCGGAADVPAEVFGVLAMIGLGYVAVFCVADRIEPLRTLGRRSAEADEEGRHTVIQLARRRRSDASEERPQPDP